MRRALLSVTDKQGIVEFARGLIELGFSILSTGGTRKALLAAGVDAVEVAEYTGFPEMMDGRLKTLHPLVHGGLLARRDLPEHRAAMTEHHIDAIDVLCVNLYRFRETVRKPGATREDIVENIDIGGPAMIRSAAKNHASVAVVVDPADYTTVLAELRGNGGQAKPAMLRKLAAKAFAHTAAYDAAIAQWFDGERRSAAGEAFFPERLAQAGEKVNDLRYGENPHQRAAVYLVGEAGPSLVGARMLNGKELSYNNLLDADAALALACEFEQPSCVLVKHNNPCGAAIAETLPQAFAMALAGDPVSAFGGILATNTRFDAATATAVVAAGTFLEVIVAPNIDAAALPILQQAKWGNSVRVLDLSGLPSGSGDRVVLRQVSGGFLAQTVDAPVHELRLDVATKRAPSDAEHRAMAFAWRVCKHVKSNAIVFAVANADGCATVGVGAGQMSRVDSARIAAEKAGERARGAVAASDAFFPFADGLLVCAQAGVTAVIQPGGSKRDSEVIAAADERNLAMVTTGQRHFRH